MDATDDGARTGRPELTDEMVRTAVRDEAERRVRQARAEAPALREPMDEMALMGAMAVTALPVRSDRLARRARVVRRVNGARRVTRVLREILARLVRRANL